MNKNWIIAMVLILAVVVVFAACKSNEKEEVTTQSTTQSTTQPIIEETDEITNETETDDGELELLPGDDLIIPEGDYSDEGALIIGGNSSDNTLDFSSNSSGEDSIGWSDL